MGIKRGQHSKTRNDKSTSSQYYEDSTRANRYNNSLYQNQDMPNIYQGSAKVLKNEKTNFTSVSMTSLPKVPHFPKPIIGSISKTSFNKDVSARASQNSQFFKSFERNYSRKKISGGGGGGGIP